MMVSMYKKLKICRYSLLGFLLMVGASNLAMGQIIDSDSDGDFVSDSQDECPNTPPDEASFVDEFGCGDSQVYILTIQFSGDGAGRVQDANNTSDFCDSTEGSCVRRVSNLSGVAEVVPAPGSEFAGWGGICSGITTEQCALDVILGEAGTLTATFNAVAAGQDADADGVDDTLDRCPSTPSIEVADDLGCSDSQVFLLTGEFLGDGSGRIQDPEDPSNFCASNDSQCLKRVITPEGTVIVSVQAVADAGSEFSAWGGLCAGTTGPICEFSGQPGTTGTVTASFNTIATTQDADLDGVSDTQDDCPSTPSTDVADEFGCGDSQVFILTGEFLGDGAGLVRDASNTADFCASTDADCIRRVTDPSNVVTVEAVPAEGSEFAGWGGLCAGTTGPQCELSAPPGQSGTVIATFNAIATVQDADLDGVPDAQDECPDTPSTDVADEFGCGDSQVFILTGEFLGDGAGRIQDASNTADFCDSTDTDCIRRVTDPNNVVTVEAVPAEGSEFAGWGGLCAGTTGPQCELSVPPGQGGSVTATFNALSQPDTDLDGVPDNIDECPDTVPDATVDSVGCSVADEEIKDFGEDLGTLEGLTESEQEVAVEVDNTCAALVQADESDDVELTAEQQDLRNACSNLKNNNSTPEQQAEALRVITPEEEIGAQVDYIVNLANAQNQHVTNRLNVVSAGGGRGVSIAGLNLNVAGQVIPGHVIENTLKEMLAGSGDSFVDFGKLGVFLQGDLDFGERDQDANNDGYEFDSWSLTAGADYRFTDTFFAGASVSMGAVEVTTRDRLGNTDVDNIRLTTYAGWQITDNLFIDGQLAYTKADYELARTVAYTDAGGDFRSVYLGDTDGDQLSAGLNIGYMLNKGGWRFGPTATVSYIDGTVNGYRERAREGDSSAWAFAINDQDYSLLRTTLGVQVDYAIATDFGVLLPGFRAAYVNEDEDANEFVPLTFINNPFGGIDGNTITVTKPTRDSQYFDSAFNLSGQFPYGISAYASYRFYSAFDGYEQTGYTLGIRWDRAF